MEFLGIRRDLRWSCPPFTGAFINHCFNKRSKKQCHKWVFTYRITEQTHTATEIGWLNTLQLRSRGREVGLLGSIAEHPSRANTTPMPQNSAHTDLRRNRKQGPDCGSDPNSAPPPSSQRKINVKILTAVSERCIFGAVWRLSPYCARNYPIVVIAIWQSLITLQFYFGFSLDVKTQPNILRPKAVLPKSLTWKCVRSRLSQSENYH